MKLYLAGRFNSGPTLDEHAREATGHGHTITSRWHTGNQHGDPTADWTPDDPQMGRYALEDVEDVQACDAVVSFTAGGGGKGGRHVEFGLGVALGKRLYIVGPREHVFHALGRVEQHDTWTETLAAIDRCDDALAGVPSEGTQVTALDPRTGQTNTIKIVNDYVLITDGRAYRHGVQVHRRNDGGWTHVVTVKADSPAVAS